MSLTGFYTNVGGIKTDLIDMFDPRSSAKTTNTGFKTVTNDDLADIFEPYPGAGNKATITGYVGGSGVDLCNTFKKVTPFPTQNPSTLTTTNTSIQSVCMYQNYVLIVSQSYGSMLRSTNYGATFSAITYPSNSNFTNALWRYVAMNQNQAVAVSTTSVFTSNDYGVNWTHRTVITSTNFSGCAMYNGLMAVADQANSKLYYSTDNGGSWLSQSYPFPRGLAITMNGTNYVVVVSGMDTATGVSPTNFSVFNTFNPSVISNLFVTATYSGTAPLVLALDGQYGLASCYTGTGPRIKYSTNYGQNWYDTATINDVYGLTSVSLSRGYGIITNIRTCYISNDNGQTWNILNPPANYTTNSYSTAANYGVRHTLYNGNAPNTFCNYGAISNTTTNFTSFITQTPTTVTTNNTRIGFSCMYQNYVIAVSQAGGVVSRSTDYGATFASVSIPNFNLSAWQWRCAAIDQNNVIIVSTLRAYTSSDYGANWTQSIEVASGNILGCALYNGLMMFADQSNSTLYFKKTTDATWRTQSVSFPRSCAITMNGANYVVLITRMTAGNNDTPEFCNICTNFDPSVTTNIFVNTTYSGSIPFMVALEGKYGVCTCQTGSGNKTIKYSSDYGISWTDVSENITSSGYSVSISGGYAVAAQMSDGYYYISNNNGQNWIPQSVANSSSNPIYAASNYSNRASVFTFSGSNTYCYYGPLGTQYGIDVSFPNSTAITVTTDGVNLGGSCMYQNVVITVSASGGSMRRSTNYGAAYSAVTNASFSGLLWRGVAMYQNQAIAISTTRQFTSSDYGATWTERTLTTRVGDQTVRCALYNGLMIVSDGQNNLIHSSTNNGVSWVSQSFTSPSGVSISMNGANYVVAVIGSGTINICSNFNPASTLNTFVPAKTYNATGSTFPTVVALDGQYGIIGCWSGTASRIKYSSDYGINWTDVTPAITVPIGSLSFSGGYAIAANYETTYWTSNNNGQTWKSAVTLNNFAAVTGANYSNRATLFTWTSNPMGYYGELR